MATELSVVIRIERNNVDVEACIEAIQDGTDGRVIEWDIEEDV